MICVAYSKKTANNRLREQVGIKEQNDRIRDYASRIGLKISKFYEDKSDDPLSDNGYQQLRLDGMNRKFDLVLLESVNRFGAGNGMARSLLVDTFSIIGIDFIVTQDGFDSREHLYVHRRAEQRKRAIPGGRSQQHADQHREYVH